MEGWDFLAGDYIFHPSSICWAPSESERQLYSELSITIIMKHDQVRIQDLVKGGPQLLRPKVADVAKQSCASEVSNLQPGSRACLRALEAFGFLMLKYMYSPTF